MKTYVSKPGASLVRGGSEGQTLGRLASVSRRF